MAELLNGIEFWWWWSLAVVLVGLEIMAPGAFLVWIAVAAAVLGLVVLVVPDIEWTYQFLLFAIFSVTSIVAFRYWRKRHPIDGDDALLNRRGAQHVGDVALVEGTFEAGVGRVKIGDATWLARSKDGSDFARGVKVRIESIDGATFIVAPHR